MFIYIYFLIWLISFSFPAALCNRSTFPLSKLFRSDRFKISLRSKNPTAFGSNIHLVDLGQTFGPSANALAKKYIHKLIFFFFFTFVFVFNLFCLFI